MSEYVPFGDEWKKHVAKLPKREIVEMLAKALREKQEVQLDLFRVQQAAQQGVQATGLTFCLRCGIWQPVNAAGECGICHPPRA